MLQLKNSSHELKFMYFKSNEWNFHYVYGSKITVTDLINSRGVYSILRVQEGRLIDKVCFQQTHKESLKLAEYLLDQLIGSGHPEIHIAFSNPNF